MEGPSSEGAAAGPTLETFSPAVGQSFAVGNEGEAKVELVLAEAAAEDSGAHAPRPSFSLLFHGPADPFLPQGTYRFQHEAIEAMEIFVVPLGRDEHGTVYQAVFA